MSLRVFFNDGKDKRFQYDSRSVDLDYLLSVIYKIYSPFEFYVVNNRIFEYSV